MFGTTSVPDENTGLVPSAARQSYKARRSINLWKSVACISSVVALIVTGRNWQLTHNRYYFKHEKTGKCSFCHLNTKPPKMHDDKSYTISIDGEDVMVTPVTITYNYELFDGQNLFTDAEAELLTNFDFDYAVLGITSARNLHRDTNEPVSLDEVYMHHFTFCPFNMIGAEVMTRDEEMPYMSFPHGYALHIMAEDSPHINTNAHLLSNKDLAPINGSLTLAHKHCNECFYAPHKGSDCTPEKSGTFQCCGDSKACMAGELCTCATNAPTNTAKTTKYKIEVDVLISRNVHKFIRIDQWNFAAPSCQVNLLGDSIFEEYHPDNYCFNNKLKLTTGGGALFHQIPQDDENPFIHTKVNVIAPAGGTIFWAVAHLHTGGINATLRLNGKVICSAGAIYGSDNSENNALNEKNHLIQIEPCHEIESTSVHFNADDVFTTESFYYGGTDDERFEGYGAAGEHKNVMSMMFMGVVFEGNAEYLFKNRTSFNLWNDFVHLADFEKHYLGKDDYKN